MSIIKTIAAGVAALSLIAAPVLANSQTVRVADRVGAVQEDEDRVPVAAVIIGAGVLLAVVLVSSGSGDDSESD